MPNPWIILAATIAFVIAVSSAYLKGHSNGVDDENSRWTSAVEKQKTEAANTLAAMTQRALEAERHNREQTAALERQREEHRNELDHAYERARRGAAAAGGLRDPGARRGPSGGCPVPAAGGAPAGAAQGAQAEGVLSREAEQFLFAFAREADDQLDLLHLCHADALRRHGLTEPGRD